MTAPTTEIELSKAVLDEFARMASALEEYDTQGMESIMQGIFAATTLDEFNSVLGADRAMPMGVSMKVDRVRWARSEFAAGLPFYLVIDGVRTDTGEAGQWVTGATTVVAMLVRAAFIGVLPIIGRAVESAEATKSGYRPVNWVMEAMNPPAAPTLDGAAKKGK